MGSSLRRFSPDRAAVLELSRHAMKKPQEQVGNPLWTTAEELESELSDWEVPPEETLLVDEIDGEVVGFAGVEVSPGFDHADLFGSLVAPSHRGQKLGDVLLEAAIERAENRSARRVVGAVGTRNATGRLLLERAGFASSGSATAVFRLNEPDHRRVGTGPVGSRFGRERARISTRPCSSTASASPTAPFRRARGSPASSRAPSTSARRAARGAQWSTSTPPIAGSTTSA